MSLSAVDPQPHRSRRLVLALSALLPLPGLLTSPPDTMLPIYSLFVVVVFARRPFEAAAKSLRIPRSLAFGALILVSGLFTETLAWTSSYLARAPEPALLHPQLAYDLLLSPVVYGGWALAWPILMRRWRYSLAEVFAIQGIYGVLLEQQGAVLRQGLASMPWGVVMWAYVFLVYGSAIGLAYLPFERSYAAEGRRRGWGRLPAALVVALLATIFSSLVWAGVLHVLG
ncbi:MAG: hypothetical protein EHM59_22705, partial [Betaproteobacteria bacterium]